MAITFFGTDGTVGQSPGAVRWSNAGVPFLVDGPPDLKVTAAVGQQRTVAVAGGRALVCGVYVHSTSARYIQLSSNTAASTRYDVIVLRVTWSSETNASIVTLGAVEGTAGAGIPTVTRTPGVYYEAPLAVVSVVPNAGQFSSAVVRPIAPYGGRGGPLHVLQSQSWSIVDAPAGTELVTDNNLYRYQKNITGSWNLIEANDQSWSTWTPQLRTPYGDVFLGTGGIWSGRYKIIKSVVFAEVEVRRGTAGSNFYKGDITVDLPVPSGTAATVTDRWCTAHLLTSQEEPMDWLAQVLIRPNVAYGLVWSSTASDDCRMAPWRSADSTGNAGTGRPRINTGYTEADVFTTFLRYSIDT